VMVGGCTDYKTALHLMRTGAAGVIVGVGADEWATTDTVLGIRVPMATAIAAAAAPPAPPPPAPPPRLPGRDRWPLRAPDRRRRHRHLRRHREGDRLRR